MKYILTGFLLLRCVCGNAQILPSAQRQKILDKQENNRSTVRTNTIITVFAPEKIVCSKPKFKKGYINLFNEYSDSVIVNIFWSGRPKQKFTVKSGLDIALPFNEKCNSLIIFNDKKNFCTNDLQPGTNYHLTWDAISNCYCLSEYK